MTSNCSFSLKQYIFFLFLFGLVFLIYTFVSRTTFTAILLNKRHVDNLDKIRSSNEFFLKYFLNASCVFIKNSFYVIWHF